MSVQNSPSRAPRRVDLPGVAGGVLLLVVFLGAIFLSRGWDGNAALFPRGVSALGAVLALSLVVQSLLAREHPPLPPTPAEQAQEEADVEDHDLDYIFAASSARTWARILAYFLSFFLGLAVLGLYAIAALFTVVYLRLEARRSWLFCAIYAAALTGACYLIFEIVLKQPIPAGLFLPS